MSYILLFLSLLCQGRVGLFIFFFLFYRKKFMDYRFYQWWWRSCCLSLHDYLFDAWLDNCKLNCPLVQYCFLVVYPFFFPGLFPNSLFDFYFSNQLVRVVFFFWILFTDNASITWPLVVSVTNRNVTIIRIIYVYLNNNGHIEKIFSFVLFICDDCF